VTTVYVLKEPHAFGAEFIELVPCGECKGLLPKDSISAHEDWHRGAAKLLIYLLRVVDYLSKTHGVTEETLLHNVTIED
jgi:hypothetical protein